MFRIVLFDFYKFLWWLVVGRVIVIDVELGDEFEVI